MVADLGGGGRGSIGLWNPTKTSFILDCDQPDHRNSVTIEIIIKVESNTLNLCKVSSRRKKQSDPLLSYFQKEAKL